MNINPLTSPMLTQSAILVTQGINPCGCTINRIHTKDNQATLSAGQLTSPLATQQFANGQAHQAELHIFSSAANGPDPIHLKGKVTQGNDHSIVFTCQPSADVLSELRAMDITPGRHSGADNRTTTDSLKRAYHKHGTALLSDLLADFLEETIAECVEGLEVIDTLREIQVDFAQGYGIAKPRRLDSITADMVSHKGSPL